MPSIPLKDNVSYTRHNGKLIFLKNQSFVVEDKLDQIKSLFKKSRKLYLFLKYLISPLYFNKTLKRFIDTHISDKNGCFVNLGAGSFSLHSKIKNVDVFPYEHVDYVCDISDLPFADNCVDIVFNISVLEHVPSPQKVVAEIHRILRPGGLVYSDVPFVVGFHASPYDFNRWTDLGLRKLYEDFEVESLSIGNGPTSSLLWIFQEWLALVLSFGSCRLHTVMYLLIMIATFPIKFFDLILSHHPMAKNIAAAFILVGRKK